MLSKSNTYDMHDVNNNLPNNLGKKFKLQVSQDNKVLPSIELHPKVTQQSSES